MTAVNHELMHAVGTEPAWSESYYFNFVDPISKIGMFTRMGFRPEDGWVDALHVIYLAGSQVAFTYGRRNIEANLSTYDVLITTQYQPNSIIHKGVNLTGKIADGTPTGTPIEIKGRVLNVCPTKVPMPGGATFINEGLTEFHWDGKTGYGISEHWHAVMKS
jgi:hypothetical protein